MHVHVCVVENGELSEYNKEETMYCCFFSILFFSWPSVDSEIVLCSVEYTALLQWLSATIQCNIVSMATQKRCCAKITFCQQRKKRNLRKHK